MKFWFCNEYIPNISNWWTVTQPEKLRNHLTKLPYAEEVNVRKQMEKSLILQFHTKEYIEHLEASSESQSGFEWTKEMYESSRYRCQGQLEAAEYALSNRTAAFNTGAGFHHAESGTTYGYCTLNGHVLTHIALKQKNPNHKTAVLDLDAHFGNGCHQYADLDNEKSFIHLDGSLRLSNNTFDSYMFRVEWCMDKLRFFEPNLIIFNEGMDVLKGDPVGHGILTLEEAKERDAIVYNFAKDNDVPILTTFAGGYQKKAIIGHINSFKIAAKVYGEIH